MGNISLSVVPSKPFQPSLSNSFITLAPEVTKTYYMKIKQPGTKVIKHF